MKVAKDQYNNLIWAELSIKGTTYLCPNCKEVVVPAGGGAQRAHFRHKVGGNYEACELFVKGLESEVHSKQPDIYKENDILFIYDIGNMKQNEDYTILSFQVYDLNRGTIPFPRFCNMSQEDVEYYSVKRILEYISEKGLKCKHIQSICNYQSIEKQLFKVKNFDVNINAAIDVGFGVLELHKGEYAGHKFMFDPSQDHHCFSENKEIKELELLFGVKRMSREERFNRFNSRLGMYLKGSLTNDRFMEKMF